MYSFKWILELYNYFIHHFLFRIPALTVEQLPHLTPEQIPALTCQQIPALTVRRRLYKLFLICFLINQFSTTNLSFYCICCFFFLETPVTTSLKIDFIFTFIYLFFFSFVQNPSLNCASNSRFDFKANSCLDRKSNSCLDYCTSNCRAVFFFIYAKKC